MRLDLVMDEVARKLAAIPGLSNTFAYPPSTATAPAGIVSYPDAIEFDATYGRGMDRIRGLSVVLMAGRVTDKSSRDTVAGWAAGTGTGSVKYVLEQATYSSCDDVTVTRCSFDTVSVSGIDYIAAMFELDVVGGGGS